MTPTKARRISGNDEEEVAASELKVGDRIRIRPGDNIAADGKIVSGQGSINQANITGESLPIDKATGDEVFAGTLPTDAGSLLEASLDLIGRQLEISVGTVSGRLYTVQSIVDPISGTWQNLPDAQFFKTAHESHFQLVGISKDTT